jgi:cell division cycle 14
VYTPNDYVPVFKRLGVSLVVRLNNKTYEANDFKKNGIKHKEMYFPDGSVPPLSMVQ